MKRFSLILITIIVLSCGSDDENVTQPVADNYAGTYKIIGFYSAQGVYDDYTGECNTPTASPESYHLDGNNKYTNYLTCHPESDLATEGTYIFSENNLTFYFQDRTTVYRVSDLSDNKVEWRLLAVTTPGSTVNSKLILQKQ